MGVLGVGEEVHEEVFGFVVALPRGWWVLPISPVAVLALVFLSVLILVTFTFGL